MVKECALSTGKLPVGGLPWDSVVRINDRPDMTSAVDSGHKASTQPTNQLLSASVFCQTAKLLKIDRRPIHSQLDNITK